MRFIYTTLLFLAVSSPSHPSIVVRRASLLMKHSQLEDSEVSCHTKAVVCELRSAEKDWDDEVGDDYFHFRISDIEPTLCTHLVFRNAELIPGSKRIFLGRQKKFAESMYRQLSELGKANPHLKLIFSVGGGGNLSVSKGPLSFGILARKKGLKKSFIKSVTRLIEKYEFHGVDVEWNRPGADRQATIENAEEYLPQLMEVYAIQNLRSKLQRKYILTMSVDGNPILRPSAELLQNVSVFVDHFHVQTHNTGPYEDVTFHYAPLKGNDNETSVEEVVRFYKEHVPSDKLVITLPAHGQMFRLKEQQDFELSRTSEWNGLSKEVVQNDDTKSGGDWPRPSYHDICHDLTSQKGWIQYFDETCRAPFAKRGQWWLSFDDLNSTQEKVEFALQENLKGVMLTTIDGDDFDGGGCRSRALVKFPLLRAINHKIAVALGSTCKKHKDSSDPLGLLVGVGGVLFMACAAVMVVVIMKKSGCHIRVFPETRLSNGETGLSEERK